ncbi:biotin carboxylase [Variovorax sp. JS1663]|nr:biotin carboxylase [Variovorax sp. JS1663]
MLDEPGLEGTVVALTADHHAYASEHERATRAQIAWRLARLKKARFQGEYDSAQSYAAPVYFVPSDTLVGSTWAETLGIQSHQALFGGVVPHPFVLTKTITHPLVDPGAAAPAGWSHGFAGQVAHTVLEGYSAFAADDARRAGLRLLELGPVRLKPARATGGRGQQVVRDRQALEDSLAAMDTAEIAAHGLVLEENLREPVTYSVGQVHVGNAVASYYGWQRLTVDNHGHEVYGGSDLTVARGGFDALLSLSFPDELRLAVEQARIFHRAVEGAFPGFLASRINYDVAQGVNGAGRWCSGVLEQSWRVGGASGAEIAALEIFDEQPERRAVNASCFEFYGEGVVPPPNACVYFSGVDASVGPITKYTVVEP